MLAKAYEASARARPVVALNLRPNEGRKALQSDLLVAGDSPKLAPHSIAAHRRCLQGAARSKHLSERRRTGCAVNA